MNLLRKENKKLRKEIKQLINWLKEVRKACRNKVESKTIGTQSENLLQTTGTQTEDTPVN